MTLEQLFAKTAEHPTSILIFFLMIPLTSFIAGAMTDEEERYENPWKTLYSVLIYFACIPGILALTMAMYSLIFDRQSLMDLNVIAFFVPVLAMVGTIFVIKQDVDLDYIPGFRKIPGLIMMILASFLVIILLQKTRLWVIFNGGSAFNLLLLFGGLFLVFRIGLGRFFGNAEVPKKRPVNREIW